jgi:hypothetical protein
MLTFETGNSSHEPWTNPIETEKKKSELTHKPLDHEHMIGITQWKRKEKIKVGRPILNKLNIE